jgi:hypothetical protein
MKTNTFMIFAVSIGMLSGTAACKKDNDTQKPVIAIEEPMANDTISLASTDSIHIEFTASDNEELHEVSVSVRNSAGTSFLSSTEDVDKAVYAYHEHFLPSGITGPTSFTLTIDASDHSENTESTTVSFIVIP